MEPGKHNCLNCDAELISAYCHECGQKSATHRITIPHLVKHDLVHGIWHFDKGLLFTAREAFLRPGYMAMNYIRGKRVRYYNVFYLVLLVLGINALVVHYFKVQYNITEKETTGLVMDKDSVDVSYYVRHYFKLLLFLMIPFFAFSGLRSFRRLKLNFAEHAVIAGSLLLTGAMWSFILIVVLYGTMPFDADVFHYLLYALLFVVLLQPVRVYFQVAKNVFPIGRFVLAMVSWYGWLMFQLFLVLVVVALCTGKMNIKL